MTERELGVPGALAEALRQLGEWISPSRLDRLWLFPPLSRGRSESGVIAGSCFVHEDRRLLITLAYRAEETGSGVTFTPVFQEEGEAPDDRLPRIMEGVVKRSEEARQPPRMVSIAGNPEAFTNLLEELAAPAGASVLAVARDSKE
jgi:hypothetical protein